MAFPALVSLNMKLDDKVVSAQSKKEIWLLRKTMPTLNAIA